MTVGGSRRGGGLRSTRLRPAASTSCCRTSTTTGTPTSKTRRSVSSSRPIRLGQRTTGPPPAASYEELAPVLDAADPRLAVINCLTLQGIHRNPHYSAAMAQAINRWVRDEFLDAR